MKKLYSQCGYVFIVLLLLTAGGLQAQVSNCNGFIRGKYLECGINWNGAFGSSALPPAGYHPQSSTSLYNSSACGGILYTGSALGFVADPDKNGWTTGTPAYYGDYILPGGVQEGWSIMASGVQYDAWNHNAASVDTLNGGLTNSVLSYSDSAGVRQVVSQGIVNGLYITQIVALDTTTLFFNVQVIIENTTLATFSNVFYMRTITPHNDEFSSGIGSTVNQIEYTIPDTANRTVVTSRGTVNRNAYLAISTEDTRALGFICSGSSLPNSTTIDNIYAGDAAYLYGLHDSTTGSNAMGLIYGIGVMPSGSIITLNFIYAFSGSVIDSGASGPDTSHVGVPTVYTANYRLFPNPVKNNFRVAGLLPGDHLDLYDVTGRQIQDAIESTGAGLFSLTNVAPGAYILLVRGEDGIIKTRLKLEKTGS